MINQVTNSVNKNVFAPFINKNGVDYAISKPFTPEQKDEFEAKEKTKTGHLGKNIAITALITGFGVLALMKGLPKGAYEKFNGIFKGLEEKIAVLTKKSEKSGIETVYLKTLKFAKTLTSSAKSLYSIGSVKDVIVKKVLEYLPFGQKFDNWVTGLFEKISIKTLNCSYKNTFEKIDHMSDQFVQTNGKFSESRLKEPVKIGHTEKTVSQWLEIIESKHKTIKTNYDSTFLATPRGFRLNGVRGDIKNLDKEVFETIRHIIKFISDKKTYTTFLSEELVADKKSSRMAVVEALKRAITHDVMDKFKEAKNIFAKIDDIINPADIDSRKIMRQIRQSLKEYKGLKGSEESVQRKKLVEGISEQLKELKAHVENPSNDYKDKSSQLLAYINEFESTLRDEKKGGIQEILTIYNQLLPRNEYLKLRKSAYEAVNSLNTSVDMETDLLFDKLRDLKIGAAPADTISVLASLGVVGWGLGKAKNSDERASVALKYGIPVVGSVATTLYCTARLVSGGKSILLGLLSGIAINKIGEMLDD